MPVATQSNTPMNSSRTIKARQSQAPSFLTGICMTQIVILFITWLSTTPLAPCHSSARRHSTHLSPIVASIGSNLKASS